MANTYKVELEDGYEVWNENGKISVFKNWKADEIRNDRYLGDRVVLFLLQKIEELENSLEETRELLT